MKRSTKLILIFVIIIVATFPFWAMGPAVFLDSKRTVLSRVISPDGKRTAQVERIVVGGEPLIVIMVRPSWMPNWYLAGCAATAHYRDAAARIRWASNSAIELTHTDNRLHWNREYAPFHNNPCENLMLTFIQVRP